MINDDFTIVFNFESSLQPDSEAEPDRGTQSEQKDEMVAKEDGLDQDSCEKGLICDSSMNANSNCMEASIINTKPTLSSKIEM